MGQWLCLSPTRGSPVGKLWFCLSYRKGDAAFLGFLPRPRAVSELKTDQPPASPSLRPSSCSLPQQTSPPPQQSLSLCLGPRWHSWPSAGTALRPSSPGRAAGPGPLPPAPAARPLRGAGQRILGLSRAGESYCTALPDFLSGTQSPGPWGPKGHPGLGAWGWFSLGLF